MPDNFIRRHFVSGVSMVKISIIMPLYNAAKYLEESLKCIQQQTFTDYELICINDASLDATLRILEEFAQEDHRIRIYSNKERSGAAYSRNYGMKKADGVYLTFLDGDDVFDEEMLECAYKAAEKYYTDVVIYEQKHVLSKEIHHKQQVFHGEKFRDRYCKSVFEVKDHMPQEFLIWPSGPTSKLYKRIFIEENKLEFQNLSCANDLYFSCMVLMLSKRIIMLDDSRVMVYARDHDEPSRISSNRDPMCSFEAFLHIAEELQKRNKFMDLYQHYYYKFYNAVVSALIQCKTEEKQRAFYYFMQNEGIDRISAIGGEYYKALDEYIKTLVDQFKTRDYNSKWFVKQEQGLNMWLNQKPLSAAVINLFQQYEKQQKTIGIWGAGANGVSLLKFCKANNLHIDMMIDKDKKKQGCILEGYQVKAPEEIGDILQVIIISARYIYKSVLEELSGQNIEVIDINQFLWIY